MTDTPADTFPAEPSVAELVEVTRIRVQAHVDVLFDAAGAMDLTSAYVALGALMGVVVPGGILSQTLALVASAVYPDDPMARDHAIDRALEVSPVQAHSMVADRMMELDTQGLIEKWVSVIELFEEKKGGA